jgi:pSer/pThr/pTyr-binding forkhead associated (FHA) protein
MPWEQSRGPSVDLAFDDPAMSRQHVAIEYADEQFRVRDLGSTNGVLLNGEPVQVGEIDDGDRIEIGSHEFQLVVEVREPEPETYELPPV